MFNVLSRISKLSLLSPHGLGNGGSVRHAAKKANSGARWQGNCKRRPKFRGLKVVEGQNVTAGTIIVKQIHTFCFPGLNVGFARTGNLFAIEPGKVIMSCEKVNLNRSNPHPLVRLELGDQPNVPFYKIYYNVIPEPQPQRFKLVEKV